MTTVIIKLPEWSKKTWKRIALVVAISSASFAFCTCIACLRYVQQKTAGPFPGVFQCMLQAFPFTLLVAITVGAWVIYELIPPLPSSDDYFSLKKELTNIQRIADAYHEFIVDHYGPHKPEVILKEYGACSTNPSKTTGEKPAKPQ